MKLLTRIFSLLTIASLTLFFANCGGGGNEKPPEQVQLGKLSKTWELGTATLDGAPSAQIESDFSITFSGTFDSDNPNGPYNFNVTGTLAPSPLPASGVWIFSAIDSDGKGGLIILDDELAITYELLDNGNLILSFNCDDCDYAGSRTRSVNGDWIFSLQPA